MKIYTIAANFSILKYTEYDQLWVANFKNREDAVKAFHFKLKEAHALNDDDTITIGLDENAERWTVEKLFDDMIINGYRFQQGEGSEVNNWYVRGEELQESFNEDEIAWNN